MDRAIFKDVSNVILDALKKINKLNNTRLNITKTAFEIALQQLMKDVAVEEVSG